MSNDEIARLIGKIRERYDQVQEPSGKIVRIELDLLLADIRELYERIGSLNYALAPVGLPHAQFSGPEIVEEESPASVEPVAETKFEPGPAIEESPGTQVAEESLPPELTQKMFIPDPVPLSPIIPEESQKVHSPDPIPDPVLELEIPPENVSPIVQEIPVQKQEREGDPSVYSHETMPPVHSTLDLFGAPTATLADKFRDEKRPLNERMNLENSSDKSIGSKLRLKIADLRSAIGINDRFIFINELFEGDMRLYDDMLGRLNTCASLQEAIAVFENSKAQQGWSGELSSVERLLDFIHRRYA
jgi:hypothetical protein